MGTDGATPPSIAGTGVRGWLRAIYEKLTGGVTVGNAGVSTKAINTSTAGNTVVVTPSSGKAVRLWWYNITADADNTAKVVSGLRFGAAGAFIYRSSLSKYGQGTAHSFKSGNSYVQGAVDEALFVNLDVAQLVYVNIDYEEV
ncbi:MAG TPA: hypothetical protein VFV57_05885 [Limnobacter sp.]|nr:hypothetical protein [Limnobacter sp.]